jgi:hypothetical protein
VCKVHPLRDRRDAGPVDDEQHVPTRRREVGFSRNIDSKATARTLVKVEIDQPLLRSPRCSPS